MENFFSGEGGIQRKVNREACNAKSTFSSKEMSTL